MREEIISIETLRKISRLEHENNLLKADIEASQEIISDYKKEEYLVDKLTRQLTDEYKNTEYQCKEKERLNNIIKEVREKCINKQYETNDDWLIRFAIQIIQILDKENI